MNDLPGEHDCPETGLSCVRCRKPCAVREGGRCPRCSEYARVWQQNRAVNLKAAGLCARCINPAVPGKALCQPHRDGITINRAEHRQRRHLASVEKNLNKRVRARLLTILRFYGPTRVEGVYQGALDVVCREVYGNA
jgi:hypothetical protein